MKIVYVTFLYEPELGGGAAQVVYSLAHGFASQGNEVTVITSAPVAKPLVEWKDNIKIIRFYPRNLYWVNNKDTQPAVRKIFWQLLDVWNPFVFWTMRDFIRFENPDLVHVHKLRGLSPSVWNAVKAAGAPKLVHTCHDYELISPEGQLSTRIGKLAEKRVPIMRLYQAARSNCSSVVQLASGPSQYVLDMHKRMNFFSKANIKVIPNSHGFGAWDLPLKKEKMKAKSDHPFRLLFLGRLVPEKGIEILCQAVDKCVPHFPQMILDIVGWGFIGPKLKERFGSCPNILFHDAAFGEEKERYFHNCDILVLPSLYPESFGIVVAEAFAYGKPVLASRIGALPEVIQEQETGFLFPPGNIDELASVLCELASDPTRLKSMRDACFDAAARFSTDVIFQQYQDFYNGR